MAGVFLDTGPLLDYLILRHLASAGGPYEDVRAPALVRFLLGKDVRRAFDRYSRSAGKLRTTTGVLIEIYRHIRTMHRFHCRPFWDQSRIAGELGIEEMCDPPLGSLDIDAVLEVGPVDEQLLQACRLENATLVSGDSVLRSRASLLNVRFLEPSELVAEMA
jgi:hypothetical protein